MKKLKLKALELNAREVLTRAELRKVRGSSGSGAPSNCYITCVCPSGLTQYGVLTGCTTGSCDIFSPTQAQCLTVTGQVISTSCYQACNHH